MRRSLGLSFITLVSCIASMAHAEISVSDAYARTSRPGAPTGAVFMQINNHGSKDDRLLSATSQVAARVELHTHIDAGNGIMHMRKVEEGFVIPAHGSHTLTRGGDHIMLLGLTRTLKDRQRIPITLILENAGTVQVEIPVDNHRRPRSNNTSH